MVRAIIALVLLATAPGAAKSELVQVRLNSLETTYTWRRDTHTGEEYGGPVVATVRLPEGVASVRSIVVFVQGELVEGGEWSLGCPGEGCGPLIWYTTRFEVSGPCVSVAHGDHYGYEPGPFMVNLEIEDCGEFARYPVSDVEITAWSHQVTSSPQNGWTPEPRVEVSNFILLFDLEFEVDTSPGSLSVLKTRFGTR